MSGVVLHRSVAPDGSAVLAYGAGPRAPASRPGARLREARTIDLRRWSGLAWERVAWFQTDLADPYVELLPDGRVLAVAPRERREDGVGAEPNAVLYSADGDELRRFAAGDGIAHAHVDAAGRIWCGYSVTGTTGDYGELGWGRRSPEEWIKPIGESGLTCFSDEGRCLQEYRPAPGTPIISDCTALNVAADATWIVYHPGFALVRLDARDGSMSQWDVDCFACTAVAAAGRHAILYVGLGPRAGTALAISLDAEEVQSRDTLNLSLPDGGRAADAHVVGRDGSLYAFDARAVYRLDV